MIDFGTLAKAVQMLKGDTSPENLIRVVKSFTGAFSIEIDAENKTVNVLRPGKDVISCGFAELETIFNK